MAVYGLTSLVKLRMESCVRFTADLVWRDLRMTVLYEAMNEAVEAL